MYIFGGKGVNNTKLNDLWTYNLTTHYWTQVNKCTTQEEDLLHKQPIARSGHSCDIIDNYMIIFGGLYDITKELNDMHVFNFNNQTWNRIYEEPSSFTSPLKMFNNVHHEKQVSNANDQINKEIEKDRMN